MGDRIELRGLRLMVVCGVLDHEQAQAQPFEFDVDLHVDLVEAMSDDLDDTVNYGEVLERIDAALRVERFALLEKMAGRVAEICFGVSDKVGAVTVVARKLRPPVAQDVTSTGVHIHRLRP